MAYLCTTERDTKDALCSIFVQAQMCRHCCSLFVGGQMVILLIEVTLSQDYSTQFTDKKTPNKLHPKIYTEPRGPLYRERSSVLPNVYTYMYSLSFNTQYPFVILMVWRNSADVFHIYDPKSLSCSFHQYFLHQSAHPALSRQPDITIFKLWNIMLSVKSILVHRF